MMALIVAIYLPYKHVVMDNSPATGNFHMVQVSCIAPASC